MLFSSFSPSRHEAANKPLPHLMVNLIGNASVHNNFQSQPRVAVLEAAVPKMRLAACHESDVQGSKQAEASSAIVRVYMYACQYRVK